MQENQEQHPPYQNTLGFRIIQGHGAEDLPPEMKAEMHKIMRHLSDLDPDDIESIVVVARVKTVGPNGSPGFGMVVASLGSQELVLGSSLMLNEYLVKGAGGMPAVMAAVLGAVGEGEESSQGCGDPSCPNCGDPSCPNCGGQPATTH